MKKTIIFIMICCAALALFVSSCSSKKDGGGAYLNSPSSGRAYDDSYGGGLSNSTVTDSAEFTDQSPAPAAVYETASSGGSGGSYTGAFENIPSAAVNAAMYIKTANISLGSQNFDADSNFIRDTVANSGGFFENSNMRTSKDRYDRTFKLYNAVIRVPSANYEYVKNAVDSTGVLYASSESTQEVSSEYFNMKSRLETFKAERERLLQIIEQETEMKQIIKYETRLNEVSTQIDIYETQIRRLEDQVAYSTITLEMTELLPIVEEIEEIEVVEEIEEVEEPAPPTFLERLSGTFKNSVDGTLAFFQGILVFIAYVCVPLIIIAAMAFAGVLAYRRAKRIT